MLRRRPPAARRRRRRRRPCGAPASRGRLLAGGRVVAPAANQSVRGALEACVGALGTAAHNPGDLIGEADALLRYRPRDGGAARDLIDDEPQVLALEQPRDGRVDQVALHHAPDELLDAWAVDYAVDDSPHSRTLERGLD